MLNKSQKPDPIKGKRSEKREQPCKGPREPKEPKTRTLKGRRTLAKRGAYSKRTARDHAAFVEAVCERDDYTCQGAGFFAWFADTYPEEFAEKFPRGLNIQRDGKIEVHHVLLKSTHRQHAFNPDNGIVLDGGCHRPVHRKGLVKRFQEWRALNHEPFRVLLEAGR